MAVKNYNVLDPLARIWAKTIKIVASLAFSSPNVAVQIIYTAGLCRKQNQFSMNIQRVIKFQINLFGGHFEPCPCVAHYAMWHFLVFFTKGLSHNIQRKNSENTTLVKFSLQCLAFLNVTEESIQSLLRSEYQCTVFPSCLSYLFETRYQLAHWKGF